MTELVTPGLTEAEVRDAALARHAARWYCCEVWTCSRCTATFRVKPADIGKKYDHATAYVYFEPKPGKPPSFASALCPHCGARVNAHGRDDPEPQRDLPGDPVPMIVLAVAFAAVVALVLLVYFLGWGAS